MKDINGHRKLRNEDKMKIMTCGKAKKRISPLESSGADKYKEFIRDKFKRGGDTQGTSKEKMKLYAQAWQQHKKEIKKAKSKG